MHVFLMAATAFLCHSRGHFWNKNQKPDSSHSRSREIAMTTPHVLIIGAGPAGAALAFLLSRRGVAVTLLEKHPDFTRAFRGEGLQPSGVEAFAQMGLSEQLARLPQAIVDTLHMYQSGRLRATIPTGKTGFVGRFVAVHQVRHV